MQKLCSTLIPVSNCSWVENVCLSSPIVIEPLSITATHYQTLFGMDLNPDPMLGGTKNHPVGSPMTTIAHVFFLALMALILISDYPVLSTSITHCYQWMLQYQYCNLPTKTVAALTIFSTHTNR